MSERKFQGETSLTGLCSVRLAREEDIYSIYSIHTRSIRQLCLTHYKEDEIEDWAGRQEPGKYIHFINQGSIYVAEKSSEVVGFGHLENDLQSEVKGLYVSPEYAGTGIGSSLLKRMESDARIKGALELVVKSTLNAQSFYEGQGFVPVLEQSVHVVGDHELACVRLRKDISLHQSGGTNDH